MSTLVASHVSGREVRAALYQNPIWQFEVAFEGLDGSSTGQYPGLGAQSTQALMGLFLQCGGQFGPFTFMDPTDYQVSAQGFGVGDGVTTAFQLVRTLGGFVEPIVAPFNPAGQSLISFPGVTAFYAPMNLFNNSVAASLGLALVGATLTSGQTDPNGGALAGLFAETTATSRHTATGPAIAVPAGAQVTFSAYLKQGGTRYIELEISNGSNNFAIGVFDLQNGVAVAQRLGGVAGNLLLTVSAAAGGFWRCGVSCVMDTTSTAAYAAIVGNNNSTSALSVPSYAGSTSNTITIAFPQVEIDLAPSAPSPFNPTLTTLYYGGPAITEAGTYIDPSAYALTNGTVAFATAPAPGAVLAWSGFFSFLCRFDDDAVDFEQFMSNLWKVESLKFKSLRAQ